jgi:hypothetical protein
MTGHTKTCQHAWAVSSAHLPACVVLRLAMYRLDMVVHLPDRYAARTTWKLARRLWLHAWILGRGPLNYVLVPVESIASPGVPRTRYRECTSRVEFPRRLCTPTRYMEQRSVRGFLKKDFLPGELGPTLTTKNGSKKDKKVGVVGTFPISYRRKNAHDSPFLSKSVKKVSKKAKKRGPFWGRIVGKIEDRRLFAKMQNEIMATRGSTAWTIQLVPRNRLFLA